MLRIVARVLIARQHDLCGIVPEAATFRTPVYLHLVGAAELA